MAVDCIDAESSKMKTMFGSTAEVRESSGSCAIWACRVRLAPRTVAPSTHRILLLRTMSVAPRCHCASSVDCSQTSLPSGRLQAPEAGGYTVGSQLATSGPKPRAVIRYVAVVL